VADTERVGQGWDIHRLTAGRPLVLGGVAIPHARGLAGHSDADVLVHALIDALLGAASDGDIGTHFPDSDVSWRDASSLTLLERVSERLRAAGWDIGNVDATIVAEAPRIGPHREEMREKLAHAMRIEPRRVSVKAKTAEGLGPEGAGEAISAQAVALLRRPADEITA
jgi:2-C-methyl-D-erythritol 2,4-cyclodiphosphate synthase